MDVDEPDGFLVAGPRFFPHIYWRKYKIAFVFVISLKIPLNIKETVSRDFRPSVFSSIDYT
jgi:hypothetical protein